MSIKSTYERKVFLIFSALILTWANFTFAGAMIGGGVNQASDSTNIFSYKYIYYTQNGGLDTSNTTLNWNSSCGSSRCLGYSYNASGSGWADKANLGAQSSISVQGSPPGEPNYLIQATTDVGYSDGLRITGGTGTGVLAMTYSLHGLFGGNGNTGVDSYSIGDSTGGLTIRAFEGNSLSGNLINVYSQTNNGPIVNHDPFLILNSGTNTEAFYIPFTYDTPFTFAVDLSTSARFVNGDVTPFFSNVDFYNTAILESAFVLSGTPSAPGSQVSGVTIHADSGINYDSNSTAIAPEPNALILLSLGLVPLLWRPKQKAYPKSNRSFQYALPPD